MSAQTCEWATTTNLDASYSIIDGNGALTMNNPGVVNIDGRDLLVGDLFLVKDQIFLEDNGIYYCVVAGDVDVNGIFYRYSGFSNADQMNSYGFVNILFGDTQALSSWLINQIVEEVGVSQITFSQTVNNSGYFDAKQITFTGGNGINEIIIPDSLVNGLSIKDTSFDFISFSSAGQSISIDRPTTMTQPLSMTQNTTLENNSSTYSTGTASLNSATVTGTGTTFPTACVGGIIYWPNQSISREIISRDSATQLTVNSTVLTFSADNYIIYYNGIYFDKFGLRQLAGQTLLTNSIDTPDTAVGQGTTLALGQTNCTAINSYKTTSKIGTVAWSNVVNGSATTNTTITSASTTAPFVFGQMTEVAFDTICIAGSVSANLTGDTALSENAFFSFLACQSANGNDGRNITFQTPGNLAAGVYMVEYGLIFGNVAGICDISYKANGAGAFSALRTGVDLYTDFGDGYTSLFREFITITTAGNPLYIKWTANGKNAGSGAYWVRLAGPIRVTKLG